MTRRTGTDTPESEDIYGCICKDMIEKSPKS